MTTVAVVGNVGTVVVVVLTETRRTAPCPVATKGERPQAREDPGEAAEHDRGSTDGCRVLVQTEEIMARIKTRSCTVRQEGSSEEVGGEEDDDKRMIRRSGEREWEKEGGTA